MIKHYLSTLSLLCLLDFAWLSAMMPSFYRPRMQHLLTETVAWWPIFAFYPLYTLGLIYFVIEPALKSQASPLCAGLSGALFGSIAYATYDLTNQASLKNWSIGVTVVDIAWGACAGALVSALTVWLFQNR